MRCSPGFRILVFRKIYDMLTTRETVPDSRERVDEQERLITEIGNFMRSQVIGPRSNRDAGETQLWDIKHSHQTL